MTDRTTLVDDLLSCVDKAEWRIIGALTEEAGEVQGAYNKWKDGNTDKPKDLGDVIEETVQLLACCLILGRYFGIDTDEMLHRTDVFLIRKTFQLREKK